MDPVIAFMLVLFLVILSVTGYGIYKIGNYKPHHHKK